MNNIYYKLYLIFTQFLNYIYNLFVRKPQINFEYDLMAKLECTLDENNNLSCILKNISGTNKINLIGSNVNEIDLNLLLPSKIKKMHDTYIRSIITYGEKSEYLDKIINGQMNRTIEIINPSTQNLHSVKIILSYNEITYDMAIFDVYITDLSVIDDVINKTGLLTHDLRALIRSAKNFVMEIRQSNNEKNKIIHKNIIDVKNKLFYINKQLTTQKPQDVTNILIDIENEKDSFNNDVPIEELQKIKSTNDEILQILDDLKISLDDINLTNQLHTLDEILSETHKMCIYSRASLLPNNDFSQSKIDTYESQKIYIILPQMICKLRDIYNIEINITIHTTMKILKNQKDPLWHLLLNMIKNSQNAGADQININASEIKNEILILIKDNGKGFTNDQKEDFCIRQLPNSLIHRTVDENRGEGFILSHNRWKKHNGLVRIVTSEINKGTIFEIKTKGYPSDDKINNIEHIDIVLSTNKKILLLVDDVFMNIKILCKKILGNDYDINKLQAPDNWNEKGIMVIETLKYLLILCGNGLIGFEMGMISKPHMIITDVEMPLSKGTEMVNDLIKNDIDTIIYINSSLERSEILSQMENNIDKIHILKKGQKIDWFEMEKHI